MQQSLFENSECQRFYRLFGLLFLLFFTLTVIFGFLQYQQTLNEITKRECSIAGNLVNTLPKENQIIQRAFISENNSADINAGEKLLDAAGYSLKTIDVVFPTLNGKVMQLIITILVFVLVAYQY